MQSYGQKKHTKINDTASGNLIKEKMLTGRKQYSNYKVMARISKEWAIVEI